MENKKFDAAFDRYIESRDYEVSRNNLFSAVRQTFMAGWEAAGGGGERPPTRPALDIVSNRPKEEEN